VTWWRLCVNDIAVGKMLHVLSVCLWLWFLQHSKHVCCVILSSVACPAVTYRVIHKYLRDFRPLRYSSWDGHAEGEHVNRGRDTPSFCPTLQVLEMCTLGDAADVNPVIRFLRHAWPSRLLYRRGRKSRRDLWVTLYFSTLSHKRHDFRRNIVIEHKMCVLILLSTTPKRVSF
jgi:hypothetical protein